jgi:endothelin-converting enzyme/putative endopeptidase
MRHPRPLAGRAGLPAAALAAFALLGAAAAPARADESPAQSLAAARAPDAAPAADGPRDALPYHPVFDRADMDTTADPCVDFYQYVCGGWQKANPIPADQSSWDVSSKMLLDNKRMLWGILDRLARAPDGRTPGQQKIGDAFAACMDEERIAALGDRPLRPRLERVEAMASKKELPRVLAALQRETNSTGLFFGFGAAPDYADSSQVIAFATAGGLGLPDRDYYLKTDAKSAQQREAYRAHVRRMFVLLGDDEATSRREADVVLSIETALARGTMTNVAARDSRNLFHKVDARGLRRATPDFDWTPFLEAVGLPRQKAFDITDPGFYRAFDHELRTRSLAELKTYLRWHVAHAAAPALSPPFVDEDFAFFHHVLEGTPQLAPRWRRCVTHVDDQLGEALGQEFVKVAFSPELRARTLHMTRQIEDAMDGEIRRLDWMSPPTKARALEKLHAITNKIGYPDRWRDYSALEIRRDDFFGNVTRANAFEFDRQLAKIGKPVDRGEWTMTPPTVNAYYDPQMNDINFPAGILQPPLFDAQLDDAPNYGDTGATIGHELTHGFDDDGRRYDARGNLRNWWTKKDEAQFKERTQCLVDQYKQYVIVDDLHINSRLTLGEDLADFGGMVLALIAYHAEEAQSPHPDTDRDGFTPIQRFFIGEGQWACANERPEVLRLRGLTDPHSPPRYRVNGLVANFKEFETAFHCTPGQPMAPVRRCRVW